MSCSGELLSISVRLHQLLQGYSSMFYEKLVIAVLLLSLWNCGVCFWSLSCVCGTKKKSLFTQFQILNVFFSWTAVLCPLTAVHSAFFFLYWLSASWSLIGLSNYWYENIFLSVSCKLVYLRIVRYKRKTVSVLLSYNACSIVLGKTEHFLALQIKSS